MAENGEDTFVRSPGGYAANVEAVKVAAPAPVAVRRRPRRARRGHPGHPDHRDPGRAGQRPLPARPTGPWHAGGHAEERGADGDRELDGSRRPLVVGVPGRSGGRPQAAGRPPGAGRGRAVRRGGLRRVPAAGQGLHRAGGARARSRRAASAYLVDPRVVEGTRWVTGANEPGRHVFDLVCGRDFTPDGVLDVAEIREGDPAPDGSGPLRLARGHRDGPHLPARPQVRRGARAQGAGRRTASWSPSPWAPTGSGCPGPSPRSPRAPATSKGLCWPRELAPFDVQLLATGKDEAVAAAAADLARCSSTRPGCRCCSTTARPARG